jgi:hypothetical protein
MESIAVTSITIPGVLERPAKQWPPLRGATRRSYRPANQIVSVTSATLRHRTTACGAVSWKRAIAGLRASS